MLFQTYALVGGAPASSPSMFWRESIPGSSLKRWLYGRYGGSTAANVITHRVMAQTDDPPSDGWTTKLTGEWGIAFAHSTFVALLLRDVCLSYIQAR